MRIIGAFYWLLTCMNLYGFFVQSSMFADVIGKISAFKRWGAVPMPLWIDGLYIESLGVIGVLLVLASKHPN